ncbi:unnamed protein product [Onchocerca flexuosa]|uniref:Reverse transcriptase domain-containing protein n=1 Tax=Onchocerca flexuosa TaxID=387005 RepID=A0A183HZB5_9BILA|nr:unnamed protein product [Onchocerca flexuosa]
MDSSARGTAIHCDNMLTTRTSPSSAAVMLTGEAFYENTKGVRIAAAPLALGNSSVEPPFHYVKIIMRAVLAAMQIIEMDEYRREVSETKKEVISNAELTLSSVGQNSTLSKYEVFYKKQNRKSKGIDSTQDMSEPKDTAKEGIFGAEDVAKCESPHLPWICQ